MFLNVIKGTYPGLQQNDKALALAAEETDVERGSLPKVNSDNEWELAGAADAGDATTPGAFLYMALQPQDDLVAGMAGNVGQGAVSASEGQPVINALAVQPSQQIETDMFDAEANWVVGGWCSVGADGVFTTHSTGETAIAKVDAVPATRWVNNAPAVVGWRTGNSKSVITLTTLYVPNMATA